MQTISIMANLGYSISLTSIEQKRASMVLKHADKVKDMMEEV